MRLMKYWLRGLVCAACLVSVPAMAQLRDISIPISSLSFGTAAIRIAKELGLFEKHGLNAKIIVMDNANSATTALISKSVEVVLSGPGELVAAQGRGQKVVAIANTYNGLSASLVLAKDVAEKTGVSPNAPAAERLKALDGLIIGSTSATSSYTVSFKGAAEAVGANIRFTYMAQPAMVAALEKGAIQGFIAGAPFWGVPVVRDKAVLWLSGPKAELPPQNLPASSVSLQTMQDFAAANPELMKSLAAVIADLGKAIEERPAEVKAAVAKLYPDVDAKTLDLLYAGEAAAWKARPLTAADMAHEVAFVKSTGTSLPQIDSVDPASMLVK